MKRNVDSRHTGKRQQAEEYLATATTMFREMELQPSLEKAAAEQAALRRCPVGHFHPAGHARKSDRL